MQNSPKEAEGTAGHQPRDLLTAECSEAVVKVPVSLFVAGYEHKVILRQNLMRDEDCQGRTAGNAASIEIDPDANDTHRQEIFLHECLHRIDSGLGWDYKKVLTHGQIHSLAVALAGLFHELHIRLDFSGLPVKD